MTSKTTCLLDNADLSVRLSWYQPGAVMTEHAHDLGQVSILLAGRLREIARNHRADSSTAYIGFKPSGLSHANVYGEAGALILSLNFPDQNCPASRGWNWQAASREEITLARQIAAETVPETERRQFALDLAASALSHQNTEAIAPGWSRQLRDQIEAGVPVDLNRAGQNFGLHPAHISRGFRKWFGAPPSLYALRCRMSRAVEALAAGEAAADAALDAGFADQSHLIRTLKRETGFTPKQLTRLLAA
ncbi:helix-turn-helix domain-containing protein [Hyphobacterium sp.]|uniref:helix-turn-helix domain-containing protein n=1 Tax=Hyphobacterium sp. TaxID=2004662 RepID=UPI003BAAC2EA